MSALEMLRSRQGACSCTACDADRQAILDAYAHELAERLRRANRNWEDDVSAVAWDAAADFVDPEVTS